jgi:hypothetical protein
MSEIKLSDLTADEKVQFKEETEGDSPGHGIIITGKYYVAAYKPVDDSVTGKCIGVEVFIHKISDYTPHEIRFRDIPNFKILFKQSWLCVGKAPFKDRLEEAVKTQTKCVMAFDKQIDGKIAEIIKSNKDREQAIADHTKNVRSCKLKIDSTIKAVAPKSKSLIEYKNEQLIAEKAEEDARQIAAAKAPKEIPFVYEESPIPENNSYESEKDKQSAVNDFILKGENFQKSGIPTKKNMQPKDFIKEMRETRTKNIHRFDEAIPLCKTELVIDPNMNNIIHAELVGPDSPKYMTNLEKQNAKRDIPLVTEKIVG